MLVPTGFGAVTVPMKHSGLSRSAAVTFGIDLSSHVGDADDAANAVQAALVTDFNTRIDSEVTIGPVVVQANFGLGTIPGTASSSDSGDLSIDSVTPNTAVLVRKNTALGGREGRGRFFLPWAIDKTDVNESGGLDPTQASNIQAALNDLLGELFAQDVPMVLLHNSVTVPTPVTSLTVDLLVGSQRRRLGR